MVVKDGVRREQMNVIFKLGDGIVSVETGIVFKMKPRIESRMKNGRQVGLIKNSWRYRTRHKKFVKTEYFFILIMCYNDPHSGGGGIGSCPFRQIDSAMGGEGEILYSPLYGTPIGETWKCPLSNPESRHHKQLNIHVNKFIIQHAIYTVHYSVQI